MEATVFTPAQQALLRMFEFDKSDETAKEIKEVLADYYQRKLDAEMNKLWDNGVISQKKLDELRKKDLHAEMRKWRNGNE